MPTRSALVLSAMSGHDHVCCMCEITYSNGYAFGVCSKQCSDHYDKLSLDDESRAIVVWLDARKEYGLS